MTTYHMHMCTFATIYTRIEISQCLYRVCREHACIVELQLAMLQRCLKPSKIKIPQCQNGIYGTVVYYTDPNIGR